MVLDYSRKYSSVELSSMDPVSVYKIILNGKFNKNFPNGFWDSKDGKAKAFNILKWLINDYLNLSRDEIIENTCIKFFVKYRLRGMLMLLFNDSPVDAIMECFPNTFNICEFKRVPNNYWSVETGVEAVKWLLEEKFRFTEDEIKTKCSYKLFKSNNLGGMLDIVFNGSSSNAIMYTYPNRFKEWELVNCPRSFWDLNNGIKATKWLVEEKMNLNPRKDLVLIKRKDFVDNGLEGMLCVLYNKSFDKALESAYPNFYK